MLIPLVSGILVLIAFLLPNPRIQEGHNLFLLDKEDDPFHETLPPPVYDFLGAEFKNAYPPENWCNKGTMWCWRTHGIPTQAYAFSSEKIWQQNVHYSRLVDHINFSDVGAFKTGWVNDWNSCFFDQISDVKRDHLPFFVRWDISDAMMGGTIQWSGDLLVGSSEAGYSHERGIMRELAITPSLLGTEVWAFRIDPESSLSVKWFPPLWWQAATFSRFLISWCAIFFLLFSIREVLPQSALISLQLLALATGVMIWINHDFVFFHPPLFAGHDGLWMEGFGFQGTQHLANGNFAEFLRGGENAFWLMPLLRYFRTLEDILFGDTNFLMVAITSSIPVLAFFCLTQFTNKKTAFLLSVTFCLIPWNLGFVRWADLSIRGLAEPIALACFLPAIHALFSPARTGKTGIPTMLLLAATCGLRPNFLPPVLLALAFLLWNDFRSSGRFRYALLLWFCTFIALIPLHNLVFSGRFVLFTTGANTVKSLPWEFWFKGFQDIVQLEWSSYHLHTIHAHLKIWVFSPAGFSESLLPEGRLQAILGYGNLLAFGLTVLTALKSRDARLRQLAWIALSAHAAGLLYHPSGRYIYLAWDLSHTLLILRSIQLCQIVRLPSGFSRFRSVPLILSTAFLAGATVSVLHLHVSANKPFELEIRMIADHSSVVAVYHDSGKGFSEREMMLSHFGANSLHNHRFAFTSLPQRLRFDPSSYPRGSIRILSIRYRFKGGFWRKMPLDNTFPRNDLLGGTSPGQYSITGDDSILYFHKTPHPSLSDRWFVGYLFYLFAGAAAGVSLLLINGRILALSVCRQTPPWPATPRQPSRQD